jgi:hypothetical protein
MLVFLGLLCTLISLGAQPAVLISGFDDNLRQSQNNDTLGALQRFLLSEDEPYTGMPQLYAHLLRVSGEKKFFVLTGMPAVFRGRAQSFLYSQAYPDHELFMRGPFDWNSVNFKLKRIEELAREGRELVVIKDNSPASLELGQELHRRYGPRLLRFYARVTAPAPLPAWATPYFTPLDIALGELKDGRLTVADAEALLEELASEEDFERIIPAWSYCPTDYAPCPEPQLRGCQQFTERVRKNCATTPGA